MMEETVEHRPLLPQGKVLSPMDVFSSWRPSAANAGRENEVLIYNFFVVFPFSIPSSLSFFDRKLRLFRRSNYNSEFGLLRFSIAFFNSL